MRRCSPTTSCPSSPRTANTLSPFALWPAFLASDYYEDSAPPRGARLTARLPGSDPADQREGDPEVVPTFTADRLTGEVPSFSPAASPWVRRRPSPWPPGRPHSPASESPELTLGRALQPGPDPPGWSRFWTCGGSTTGSYTTYTVPSRLPVPGRLVVPTRSVVVRAAPILPCASRVGLPSASADRCDGSLEGPFHPLTVQQRLVAHDRLPVHPRCSPWPRG